MRKGDYILAILQSKKTVLSFKDIILLWGEPGTNTAKTRINYYVKKGKLLPLRRGLYAKNKGYNRLELATKIFTPAYVSFETVLAREGIIFQHYDAIFTASYLTREIICDGQVYSFKTIKPLLLTNPSGIENNEECSIATKERAFLDTLYLNKDYHFDYLAPLNWEKIFAMLPFYHNQRMVKKVQEFYEHFKQGE